MRPVALTDSLFWVGAVDWNIRDFHGYSTEHGTTYNAYLAMDEKIALIDTVHRPLLDDLLHNLSQIVDPVKIDYLIINHVELDHSGSLPEIIQRVKPEKVFCSKMGKKAIIEHFHREDWPLEAVESGQTLNLGKKSVQFLETRMLHWPDSMMTFFPEDGVLVSSDAFGQHYASSGRFDDEVDYPFMFHEASKYYANILTLYSPLVQKLLTKVKESGLDIRMIAPDHGVVWRRHLPDILDAYGRWSRQEGQHRALIIYDTMWKSTEMMAKAVLAGLDAEGIPCELINLAKHHRSDVMTQVLEARAVILGSSTLNNGLLPRMAGFLMYMRGLRPTNKIGAAFGSYGWSGEAVKLLNEAMEEMKFEVIDPGIRIKYVPTQETLAPLVELGQRIGQAVRKQG